jgi:hypothetical protein
MTTEDTPGWLNADLPEEWLRDRAGEPLPTFFLPDETQQNEERNKALRNFTLNHNGQADMLVRCMLKPFYN